VLLPELIVNEWIFWRLRVSLRILPCWLRQEEFVTGEKVLLVDDREDNLQFLTEYILEPEGYSYIVAKDGLAAVQKALSEKPDLMIMDIRMPGLSGLEVLENLNERQISIPVILMTFHGSEETAVQAFRLGARDYVIKPFEVDEMIRAINRALSETRLRHEKDRLGEVLLRSNQQLSRRVKEQNALFGIGKSVTSLLDLERVLNRIVEAAVYLTGAEEGTLLLVDEDTGELYMRAARNLGDKYARGFRLKVDDSIAGQVVKTGKPVLAQVQDSGAALKIKTGYLVRALLNVPLNAADRVIGVLSVDNRLSARAFSQNDQYLLSGLADWATIAIENARVVESLQEARDEISKWNEELELKVAERTRELKAAQDQLIQSEKLASIGQLASGVAHEINNPIGVILGFAQVLVRRAEKDDPMFKPLQSIEREALRCKAIVHNLLDFARRTTPTLQSLELYRVLDTTCELLTHQLADQGTQIIKSYDSDLPLIMGDANQLQQVFTNIIMNAHQAMTDGGELRISTRKVGDEVHVLFADTGEGIDSENVGRIFDPFFTTKEVGQGTGLGLSVSYGIVQNHGGTIEVESKLGVGSVFSVRLPLSGKRIERRKAS
jgi:two-component system NtrC family sensor kinase